MGQPVVQASLHLGPALTVTPDPDHAGEGRPQNDRDATRPPNGAAGCHRRRRHRVVGSPPGRARGMVRAGPPHRRYRGLLGRRRHAGPAQRRLARRRTVVAAGSGVAAAVARGRLSGWAAPRRDHRSRVAGGGGRPGRRGRPAHRCGLALAAGTSGDLGVVRPRRRTPTGPRHSARLPGTHRTRGGQPCAAGRAGGGLCASRRSSGHRR